MLKALLLSERNLATGSQSELSASIKGRVQLVTTLGGHRDVFGAERASVTKTTFFEENQVISGQTRFISAIDGDAFEGIRSESYEITEADG